MAPRRSRDRRVADGLTRLDPDRQAAALRQAIAGLCPPGVIGDAATIAELRHDPLRGVEHDLVAGVAPRRAHTFRAGRALVRRLAGTDVELPRLANGAVHGPHGRPVSLAHDDDVVAAVLGPVGGATLGIDIERGDVDAAVRSELEDVVFAPGDVPLDPVWMFVVKEAAYKAWSRPGRPVVGFDAATTVERGDGLVVTFRSPDELATDEVTVKVGWADRYVVAVAFAG